MNEMAEKRYVPAHTFAIAYAGLGDRAEMFRQLDQAVEERSSLVPYLAMEPMGREYRSDPRMEVLMGLVRHREVASPN